MPIPRKTDKYYRYNIPNVVTVQIDTREQIPMLFPELIKIGDPELTYNSLPIGVKVEKAKLDYGDYRLKEYPDICVFERKASQLELYKNMNESRDRIRQAKAFRKLATQCKFPYLLIECSPAELLANDARVKNPELLVHRISLAIAKYNLRALFIPWRSRDANIRRKVGCLMIHLMLGCVLQESFDVPPVLLEE
ncbi:MAG: hypothetical protein PVI43_00705 [Candidatus Bathyarchaeota archaeon]|jgi:hypothetical protein